MKRSGGFANNCNGQCNNDYFCYLKTMYMKDFKNAIIECVPNFSEGRNMDIIKQITDEIEQVEGVRLLDVDPGSARGSARRF